MYPSFAMKHLISLATVVLFTTSFAQEFLLETTTLRPLPGTTEVEITSVTPDGYALGFSSFAIWPHMHKRGAVYSSAKPEGIFVGIRGQRSSHALALSPKGTLIFASTSTTGKTKFHRLFGDGSVKALDAIDVTLGTTWLWNGEEAATVSNPLYQGNGHIGENPLHHASGIRLVDDRIEEDWTLPGFTARKIENKGVVKGNITVSNGNLRTAQAVIHRDLSVRLDVGSIVPCVREYVGPCDDSESSDEIFVDRRPGATRFSHICLKRGDAERKIFAPEGFVILHAFKPLDSPMFVVMKNEKTGTDGLYFYEGRLSVDAESVGKFAQVRGKNRQVIYDEFDWSLSSLVSSLDSPTFALKAQKKPKSGGNPPRAGYDVVAAKKV